jgi:hypothetical protein
MPVWLPIFQTGSCPFETEIDTTYQRAYYFRLCQIGDQATIELPNIKLMQSSAWEAIIDWNNRNKDQFLTV